MTERNHGMAPRFVENEWKMRRFSIRFESKRSMTIRTNAYLMEAVSQRSIPRSWRPTIRTRCSKGDASRDGRSRSRASPFRTQRKELLLPWILRARTFDRRIHPTQHCPFSIGSPVRRWGRIFFRNARTKRPRSNPERKI